MHNAHMLQKYEFSLFWILSLNLLFKINFCDN